MRSHVCVYMSESMHARVHPPPSSSVTKHGRIVCVCVCVGALIATAACNMLEQTLSLVRASETQTNAIKWCMACGGGCARWVMESRGVL